MWLFRQPSSLLPNQLAAQGCSGTVDPSPLSGWGYQAREAEKVRPPFLAGFFFFFNLVWVYIKVCLFLFFIFFTLMACSPGSEEGGCFFLFFLFFLFLKGKFPHDLFLLFMQPSKTCFSSPGIQRFRARREAAPQRTLPEGASSWIAQLGRWVHLFTNNPLTPTPTLESSCQGSSGEQGSIFFLLIGIECHAVSPHVKSPQRPHTPKSQLFAKSLLVLPSQQSQDLPRGVENNIPSHLSCRALRQDALAPPTFLTSPSRPAALWTVLIGQPQPRPSGLPATHRDDT